MSEHEVLRSEVYVGSKRPSKAIQTLPFLIDTSMKCIINVMKNMENIETTGIPTHIALVARRVNTCPCDDLASRFLNISYLVESFLKTLAIVLYSGLKCTAKELAYSYGYAFVHSDGLGDWERCIREVCAQPTAAYFSSDFSPLIEWVTKRRNTDKEKWFSDAHHSSINMLDLLGIPDSRKSKSLKVIDLVSTLVRIRNKTKAHGAVNDDFYANANGDYLNVVVALIQSCPVISWKWLYIETRTSGKIKCVSLLGSDPHHLRSDEISEYSNALSGVSFVTAESRKVIYTGDLLLSSRDCNQFYLPNGSVNEKTNECEFIDYSNGKCDLKSLNIFSRAPVPPPSSETEGLDTFDIQSNVYGNLPQLPQGYVQRTDLENQLIERLLDKNHAIITLHGGGGMGKTTLALAVAHKLASDNDPHFEHIVWFSARDIDLKPSGPVQVSPKIIDLQSVSRRFGELFKEWGEHGTPDALAKALSFSSHISKKGILYIFDNFETMTDMRGLHQFLDSYTFLPNKVLITSRERAFVADYPIEVKGMEPKEAESLLINASRDLHIEALMTDDAIKRIFAYTNGHAYIMRVIVGEMAKEGRFVPPANLIGNRQDIVEAVFERSFNKLSENGHSVFLVVGNWASLLSEISLIVVLGNRGISANEGLDECLRLSLIQLVESRNGKTLFTAPPLARVFAKKKLKGDPDRLILQQDIQTLQHFGSTSGLVTKDDESLAVDGFINWCFTARDSFSRIDKLLFGLAECWPSAWVDLAKFRIRNVSSYDDIDYALRRAVEENPAMREAWKLRAEIARKNNNEQLQVMCLVSAVDADPENVDLITEAAGVVSSYIAANKHDIPKTRRGMYLAGIRSHMKSIEHELDATGLSRLAWLFLLEENVDEARVYAEKGLIIDPKNEHCLRILDRT